MEAESVRLHGQRPAQGAASRVPVKAPPRARGPRHDLRQGRPDASEFPRRKAGESEDRLHLVAVLREARHFYSPREQAALALTEAVTLVADAGVPDDVYTEAAAHFDERELAQVLSLILAINTWNRVALATRKTAGTDER